MNIFTYIKTLFINDNQSVIDTCINNQFIEGIDYGSAPEGSNKFLYMNGCIKILNALHLTTSTDIIEQTIDHSNGYYAYTCRTVLSDRKGTAVSTGCAACNSNEDFYRKSNPYASQNLVLQAARRRSIINATITMANLSNKFC